VLVSWGTQLLEQIDEVSMDMSGNKRFESQLLPNAVITWTDFT